MAWLDTCILALYFAGMLAYGFYYRRRAAQNLDAYFLGGRRMNWLVLAMSGSVSTFDITGTMWIVSLLFVLGMKSMWVHWMWGWMMGAFFMAYMGKWVRRSNVMTGAEWMSTRFGTDRAGRVARLAYALMAVVTLSSFVGYAFRGIGKFASVYIDLPPDLLAFSIIGVTTLYVLLGGLYSVVATDVIQTIVLTAASAVIVWLAYQALTPEALSASLPPNWASLMPVARAEGLPPSHRDYEFFGALAAIWVFKGLLQNAGGPSQQYDFQRFLAARDARDASKLGAAWSLFLVARWGMCAAIALLALTGIHNIHDPEKVMPIILKEQLPMGFRGLVIAGLLAAFMSTFSSTINSAASYLVRDFWQPYFRPDADERQAIRSSYVATVLVVVFGCVIFGLRAETIREIFDWIMLALGSGVLIPNFLRWYWWRVNGWGYAAGILAGILLSLIVLFRPDVPIYVYFPILCAASFLATVAVSLMTRPAPAETLVDFFRSVRPFGFWKPVRDKVRRESGGRLDKSESAALAAFNTATAMVVITALYLMPMYLVGHWHEQAAICASAAAAGGVVLYMTWYRNLPSREREEANHIAAEREARPTFTR